MHYSLTILAKWFRNEMQRSFNIVHSSKGNYKQNSVVEIQKEDKAIT